MKKSNLFKVSIISLISLMSLFLTGCEVMRYDDNAGPALKNMSYFQVSLWITAIVWVVVFIVCLVVVLYLLKKNKIKILDNLVDPDSYNGSEEWKKPYEEGEQPKEEVIEEIIEEPKDGATEDIIE